MYCRPCLPLIKRDRSPEAMEKQRARHSRYSKSEKGKEQRRRWIERNVVRFKTRRQRYWEANRERILARRRERYAQKRVQRVIQCATLLCQGTFVRGPRQGSKKFCDECIRIFYGPSRRRAA